MICLIILTSQFIFLGPALYFILQNYELFKNLAFDTQPEMVKYLDQEIFWLKGFALLGAAVLIFFNYLFILQIIKSVHKPLGRLEGHLKKLTAGNWNIQSFEARDEDLVKPLSLTYNHFYRTLQAQSESEIQILKKLNVDPSHREAYLAWKKLIDYKMSLIGQRKDLILPSNLESKKSLPVLKKIS